MPNGLGFPWGILAELGAFVNGAALVVTVVAERCGEQGQGISTRASGQPRCWKNASMLSVQDWLGKALPLLLAWCGLNTAMMHLTADAFTAWRPAVV
jgi:hypothetical protein